ncbi:hypothetical protein ACWPMX_07910 [Tsuneonella sp. HG094]
MSAGSIIQRLRSLGIVGRGDVVTIERPRAYTGPYPIRSHRTLAEVWGAEVDAGVEN